MHGPEVKKPEILSIKLIKIKLTNIITWQCKGICNSICLTTLVDGDVGQRKALEDGGGEGHNLSAQIIAEAVNGPIRNLIKRKVWVDGGVGQGKALVDGEGESHNLSAQMIAEAVKGLVRNLIKEMAEDFADSISKCVGDVVSKLLHKY